MTKEPGLEPAGGSGGSSPRASTGGVPGRLAAPGRRCAQSCSTWTGCSWTPSRSGSWSSVRSPAARAPWGQADQEALIGGSLERTVSWLLAKARDASRPGARTWRAGWSRAWRGWWPSAGCRCSRGRPAARRPGRGRRAVWLVTASSRAIMDAVLKVTGLSFGVTVCGEDVRRGKPDPEPYLRAAALLGVPPAGAGAGDSPTGIAAARRGLPGHRGAQRAGPPGPGLLP